MSQKDKILELLKESRLTVPELAEKMNIELNAVRTYISRLDKEGKIMKAGKQGRFVIYTIKVAKKEKKIIPGENSPEKIPIIKSTPISTELDLSTIEMAINNYLKGYKKAYENSKNNPYSKVKIDYEKVLKQREIVEKLINR
ncbi:hypothetical protein ES702_05214 [subsurface metagenome]